MKLSLHHELERQRGGRSLELEPVQRSRVSREHRLRLRSDRRSNPPWRTHLPRLTRSFRRLARRYELEAEREALQRQQRERGRER